MASVERVTGDMQPEPCAESLSPLDISDGSGPGRFRERSAAAGGGAGGTGVRGSRQADRSKNRNWSALPCGEVSFPLQPVGNGLPVPAGGAGPTAESSPPVTTPLTVTEALMWMSVNTTFPHCEA